MLRLLMKLRFAFLILFFVLIGSTAFAQLTSRKIESLPQSGNKLLFSYEINGVIPGKMARFQQKIPADFKLDSVYNSGVYSQKEKDLITIIWTELPKDTSVSLDFTVDVPKYISGTIHIGEASFMSLDSKNNLLKVSYKPCPVYINSQPYSYAHKTTYKPYEELECVADAVKDPLKLTEVESKNDSSQSDTISLEYYYRIQVSASKLQQNISDFEKYLMGNDKIIEEQHQGLYKYCIGKFSSYELAQSRAKLYETNQNLKGFLVGYIHNERVELKDMPDRKN